MDDLVELRARHFVFHVNFKEMNRINWISAFPANSVVELRICDETNSPDIPALSTELRNCISSLNLTFLLLGRPNGTLNLKSMYLQDLFVNGHMLVSVPLELLNQECALNRFHYRARLYHSDDQLLAAPVRALNVRLDLESFSPLPINFASCVDFRRFIGVHCLRCSFRSSAHTVDETIIELNLDHLPNLTELHLSGKSISMTSSSPRHLHSLSVNSRSEARLPTTLTAQCIACCSPSIFLHRIEPLRRLHLLPEFEGNLEVILQLPICVELKIPVRLINSSLINPAVAEKNSSLIEELLSRPIEIGQIELSEHLMRLAFETRDIQLVEQLQHTQNDLHWANHAKSLIRGDYIDEFIFQVQFRCDIPLEWHHILLELVHDSTDRISASAVSFAMNFIPIATARVTNHKYSSTGGTVIHSIFASIADGLVKAKSVHELVRVLLKNADATVMDSKNRKIQDLCPQEFVELLER